MKTAREKDGSQEVSLSIAADYVIPIKIGRQEEVGDAQSDDASVRSSSFQLSQSFGSGEDY